MDTNTLLTLVIALLTFNLLFVGVYIVLVLKEVREAVRKVNSILVNVDEVSESLATPVVGLSGAITGIMQGLKIFNRARDAGRRVLRKDGEKDE
ncbi:MAG: hypothetical protein ACOC6Q_00090 [Patescibacteria group bacterium]